ncbi:uncharacterized protein LOC118458944 isoform X2 [Anopheles albimanus]|uniref:uncharacterized protein LOC118458944 isoform X2 n=1 Tax=Anopheles albimanus TaxID=7167 RepID=UPI00163E5915|nr:uncharacterized protein LOC118458944 isoform X2 [Anopheles albimanus]
MQALVVFCCTLVSLHICATRADNAFIDSPPEGYYERTTLKGKERKSRKGSHSSTVPVSPFLCLILDCPSRFYSQDVSSALGFFIFGGGRAYLKEFPHMAAIGWTRVNTTTPALVEYKCGGSLIAAKFVLTAAHCGQDENRIPPDAVRLGDTNLATVEDDASAQQFKIVAFTVHDKYKRNKKYYDIALIELDREVKFTTAVCPICLWPLDNLSEYSASLKAVGFGQTSYGSDMSPVLQKVSLNYYDFDTCNNELPRPKFLKDGLTKDQFCTKTPNKDACLGDSGGPLQIELSDVSKTIPYLTGVVSFGTGCWDGSFGVYTKVSSYIDWIRERVNVTTDPIECARNSECLASRPFSDSRLSPQNNSPFFKVNLRKSDNSTFHQCTGALIDYRHVVTSATCAVRNNQRPAFVEANDELIDIIDIDLHPRYIASKSYNNLAVLTLAKFYNPNKIYQIIAPACIWKEDRITDLIVFYSGYGPEVKNEPTDKVNNVSLKILVALLSENGRCEANDAWKVNSTLAAGFNSDFLCTYNPIDLVPGICKLEPGGSVSNFRRDNIVPYVYGINAIDEGPCGGSQNLFVATRLAPSYDWIESIVLNRTIEDIPGTLNIRFGGEAESPSSLDSIFSYSSGQVINRNNLDLINNHIRPYGNDLLHRTPETTVQVYHQSLSNTPETYKIYGPHSGFSLKKANPLLHPQQNNLVHHNDIRYEVIPSIELPATHLLQQPSIPARSYPIPPYNTFTGQQQSHLRSYQPPVHPHPSPLHPYHHQHQQQQQQQQQEVLRQQQQQYHSQPSSPIIDHGGLVSIIRSIELYENGHCTLPTGVAGRCLHYTRCPSMYWNAQNTAPYHRHDSIPYCNQQRQTVCCQA